MVKDEADHRLGPALARLWQVLPRFVRNALISLPTFLFDLALLVVLIRALRLDYRIATAGAFLVTNVVSYFLSRRLVFAETRRGVRSGLVYFLIIATVGAFVLTPLMWLLVGVLHLDYFVSRILAAAIVGLAGYASNLLLNFRLAPTPYRLPLPTQENP